MTAITGVLATVVTVMPELGLFVYMSVSRKGC